MAKTLKIPSDLKSGGFKTAPGGTYSVKVTSKTDLKEKNGKPTLIVHVQITKGKHQGVTVYENIQLSKQVEWKLGQFLHAVGLSLKKIAGKELPLSKLVGKELRVILREETYQGKKTNKVTQFLRALDEDEPDEAGMDDDEDPSDLEDTDDDLDASDEDDNDGDDDDDDASDDDDVSDDEDDDAGDDEDDDAGDDDDAEDTDDDEVDDEEEPAPSRRVKKKKTVKKVVKKAAKKKTRKTR